jgi:glyoxylase-like metal-dependent hydrolase (beta-lactamase superfamily II)
MHLQLQRVEVGPWPMNCYLLRCPKTEIVAIVDPGADAQVIMSAVDSAQVLCILLTHGHPDHVGALDQVRQTTGAPVGIHPADAAVFELEADFPLTDGMVVEVGKGHVVVSHVPGHTAGSVCLQLNGNGPAVRPRQRVPAAYRPACAVVGDAIFPGGPGHTATPDALAQSLVSLGETIFSWSDQTELFPGHGDSTSVGFERPFFERFLQADHPPDLCGDVSWR